jgi:hypothetical protein
MIRAIDLNVDYGKLRSACFLFTVAKIRLSEEASVR